MLRETIADNRYVAKKVQNPVHAKRPRARRYAFVASAELVDLQSEIQVQGRVTDLNLYGCGVAASKTLPAGTKLRVRITRKGRTFWALGNVVYSIGESMGIFFSRIERNDRVILEEWISEPSSTGFPVFVIQLTPDNL